MKLNEIKTVNVGEYNLSEGVIPVHLTMTLEQVVSAGKVTNNVQHFVIAGLLGMFKDGDPLKWPRDLNSYPMCTGSETLEAVKSLSPEESVELASWLLEALKNPASYESSSCHDCKSMTEWIKWVKKKQD